LAFYFFYLFFIIILAGRYNILGYRVLKPKTGYFLACFIIIFISVFRFDIGYDYNSYYSFIYPKLIITNFEYFPRIIYHISDYFDIPILVFVIFGLINYVLIFYTIDKTSTSRYESLIIFFAMFYLTTLSTLRQSTAVAIIFYGFKYIKKKKLIKYIITCIIAFNFHRSAIIGFLLYPLYYISYYYVIGTLGALVLGIRYILPKILAVYFPRYVAYLVNQALVEASGNYMRLFYIGLLFYCIVIACLGKIFGKNRGFFSIITLGVALPFILGGHTGGRIAEYFLIYFVLLVPNVNSKLKINKRVIFLSTFYIYFFLYLLTTVYLSKSSDYIPYRFYFLTDTKQITIYN
jgi:hypothetical protein